MKQLFTLLSLCAVALLGTASCEKVSSLSDSANIERFAVTGCDPENVVFGEPAIKGTLIEVPLVYGKYLFPLTVSFDVAAEAGCAQLLGFDSGSSFTFDNLAHERNLYTVAPSGATTTWTIRIVDAMTNESAEVVRAQATAPAESGVLVAPIAQINKFDASVTFQGTGTAVYPLTVIPQITLAEGASFSEELPETLTFADKDEVKTYTVESASGRTKEWTFKTAFVASKDNSTASKFTEDQVRRLTVLAGSASLTANGVRLAECRSLFQASSSIGGEIDFMIAASDGGASVSFPLEAQIVIPTDKQAVLFGAPADNRYTFTSYTDKKQVWVADKVSGIIKCWTVAVCPELNTNLKSIEITSSACTGISNLEVDKANIVVDNERSRIIVPVANPAGTPIDPNPFKLGLTLNFKLGLYDGTTCSTVKTSHTYITNSASLTFTATNSIEKRMWTLYLKDKNAAASGDKNLSNFTLVEFASKSKRMTLDKSSYVADNDTKTITMTVTAGVDDFPLTISKKVFKTNNPTARIFPAAMSDYDAPIVFESLNSVKDFTIQAEDGTTDEWKLLLATTVTGKTADIESLLISNASNGVRPTEINVDATARHIDIVVNGIPPFDFITEFVTSNQATVSGVENDMLTFNSYADRIPVTVTSQDGSLKSQWTIGIMRPEKIQIDNSEFELWGKFSDINTNTFTINPTPGKGYGWATANLMIGSIGVQGSEPVERTDGTKAAQMTTKEQNTVFKGFVMAAGTLFTGVFTLDIGNITQPRKMTNFGIPFTARPKSFDMEVKYTPGPKLKEARPNDKGSYVIYDIPGVDKGQIWIELLRWNGPGDYSYDGNPSEKITVIGRAEVIIDGANNPYQQWTKINMPMVYNEEHNALTPTHIAVVFSSSKDGDKFIGATDSQLCADHFHINY